MDVADFVQREHESSERREEQLSRRYSDGDTQVAQRCRNPAHLAEKP